MAVNTVNKDLEVYKKDSKDYVITVKDGDGVAVDITGYTFYMTCKVGSEITDPDTGAAFKKTVTTHTTPLSGITTISVSSSDNDLDVTTSTTKYVYDIRMKDTSGKVTTFMNGNYKVLQPVTLTVS